MACLFAYFFGEVCSQKKFFVENCLSFLKIEVDSLPKIVVRRKPSSHLTCIGCRGGGGGGDACDGGRHVVPGELSLPVGGVVHRLPGVNGAVQLPVQGVKYC